MRTPRLYQPVALQTGDIIELDAQATSHVTRVLRLKQNDSVIVFNGEGGEYSGVLETIAKRIARVRLVEYRQTDNESPLSIQLFQGISRGERMDFTLQKSVELGVHDIYPVYTQYSAVHLEGERAMKKRHHWQGVVNSACEQCGRNRVPRTHEPTTLKERMNALTPGPGDISIVLDHRAERAISGIDKPVSSKVSLVVGPEGGLSEEELDWLTELGCIGVRIGPRVLRTETAALTAIALIQSQWGDFV